MKIFAILAVVAGLISVSIPVFANDEVSLFDGRGNTAAYIVLDEDLSIYLWDGNPVAYLDRDGVGGFHVYGFNGKHLGWFVDGIVWGHDGRAACAIRARLGLTGLEPLKSLRQFKPLKNFKEFAPRRPPFYNSFGDKPCHFLLAEGGA